MNTRKAVFAGNWYPGDAAECEKEINQFLRENKSSQTNTNSFIGAIVPHAGWYFSGSISCNVISVLKDETPPDVIVVFGMHLHPGSSPFIMTKGAWETPFGDIEIHEGLATEISNQFSFNIETYNNFTQDNTIELQLPFIKYFFNKIKVVTIGVTPRIESVEIGKSIAEKASNLGLKIKVIGSTDLTHYGVNYGFTPQGTGKSAHNWVRDNNDKRIIDRMIALDAEGVIDEAAKRSNACCAGAASAAISTALQCGAQKGEMLYYSNSYEKSPGDSFVGYTGIVF